MDCSEEPKESHHYLAEYYDYVVGRRDDMPAYLCEEWKHRATVDRSLHDAQRKAVHRRAVRSRLRVIK